MASNQNETWLSLGRCLGKPPSHCIRALQVCLIRLCFYLSIYSKIGDLSQIVFDSSKSWKIGDRRLQEEEGIAHEEVKARERWGQVEYAPRSECVSALCMFCTFCRFLHRRPTVRLAHVLVYLALVLVDLCTSITARQKKTFSPISATRLLFFPYLIFVAFSMLWLKTTLLQRLTTFSH